MTGTGRDKELISVRSPDPIVVRHGEIGHDNVRLRDVNQGFSRRRHGNDYGALSDQRLLQYLPGVVVVLHDEDSDPGERLSQVCVSLSGVQVTAGSAVTPVTRPKAPESCTTSQ